MIIFQRVFKLQSRYEYAEKSIKGEKTQKILKRGLSFLYVTQRHDLFYITVKYMYHQNIPNRFQVIERTRKRRTDGARLIAISPEPFSWGDNYPTRIPWNAVSSLSAHCHKTELNLKTQSLHHCYHKKTYVIHMHHFCCLRICKINAFRQCFR